MDICWRCGIRKKSRYFIVNLDLCSLTSKKSIHSESIEKNDICEMNNSKTNSKLVNKNASCQPRIPFTLEDASQSFENTAFQIKTIDSQFSKDCD